MSNLKIGNVIPITGALVTPEMIDYMRKYLSPTTILDTRAIDQGPLSIECEYDESAAAPHVVELCKSMERAKCDAIFINCFGDPGVRAAREYVDIPVFGGFEPAVHLAMGLADRIGIVTVMKNVMPMLHGNIAKSGMRDRVVSLRSIDMPVEQMHDIENVIAALLVECRKAIKDDGVEAFVLGCTAMVSVAERVHEALVAEGFDVPVIEAAQAALNMLELYATMNLRQSRITYMKPPIR